MHLPDQNFVLHNKAKTYYWKGEGLFSIKSFQGGAAYYNVGNGNYKVSEPHFLLLNHQQKYSITIDSEKPVESFTIFFQSQLVHSIYYSLLNGIEKTLQEDAEATGPAFYIRNYAFTEAFYEQFSLFRLSYNANKHNRCWLEEQLSVLAENMIRSNESNVHLIATISSCKKSTRQEIYKRILIAKEYLHAYFEREVSLNELCKISCMSINHLIRHFREIFGTTPHQYLVQLRINKSKELLANSRYSIAEITTIIGFSSVPSFCVLFMRLEGLSPSQYRLLVR